MSTTENETGSVPGHEDDENLTMEPAANGNSPLSRLRARRRELADANESGSRVVEFPIPGYSNELWVQFRYTPDLWDRIKKIGERAVKSRHPRKELNAQADTLITCCSNVLVSEDGGQNFEPLDPSGEEVGFDLRLAALLGIENPHPERPLTAREIVFHVFENDLAVSAMSNRVSEWTGEADAELDEDFSAR